MPKCLKSTPRVKETKGFVLQIQQGANREKTHMQVAEQDMSMWLGVPRIAIYVLACNDLEYFQRTPDHFDSPYWTHVFEVAMEKAQAQWSTKMKEDLEMANELLEPLEGTELPMKDGLVHGKARSTYADGGIYVGDFEENLKHGRGKMTEPDGTSYDGQWVNDQRHGSGVIRGGNGHTYEGEWANNQQHGSGLHRFANGDSYEGEFAHDQRHGRGLYCYVNGDVDAQLAEESRPKDVGVRRLAGGGYQKLQNGAVVKEVTEKEAKQLVKENGLPSLW